MRTRLLAALLLACLAGCIVAPFRTAYPSSVVFPEGKRFAFSIVDDTDKATLERLRPVYAAAERYGLKTTKTVWVMDSSDTTNSADGGVSLHDPAYRAFIVDLQRKGFEIALHGVRGGSSRREETLRGLEEFREVLGHYPRMQINHSRNRDNLYWGRHVYDSWPFRAAALAMPERFSGHDEASEYFWGDAAKEHIEYVRRSSYAGINLLALAPVMPYHLKNKPYVNYWFHAANGSTLEAFDALLKDENLDRLERERGVCIVYAHLGLGTFNRGTGVDPRFEARLAAVSRRNGWFVPASTILDHLRTQAGWSGSLGFWDRLRLDAKIVAERVATGLF